MGGLILAGILACTMSTSDSQLLAASSGISKNLIQDCFGAKLTLDETQSALKYYGMSELYARVPRDAVMIIAFNSGIYDVFEVDALLLRHQMPPLRPCHGGD